MFYILVFLLLKCSSFPIGRIPYKPQQKKYVGKETEEKNTTTKANNCFLDTWQKCFSWFDKVSECGEDRGTNGSNSLLQLTKKPNTYLTTAQDAYKSYSVDFATSLKHETQCSSDTIQDFFNAVQVVTRKEEICTCDHQQELSLIPSYDVRSNRIQPEVLFLQSGKEKKPSPLGFIYVQDFQDTKPVYDIRIRLPFLQPTAVQLSGNGSYHAFMNAALATLSQQLEIPEDILCPCILRREGGRLMLDLTITPKINPSDYLELRFTVVKLQILMKRNLFSFVFNGPNNTTLAAVSSSLTMNMLHEYESSEWVAAKALLLFPIAFLLFFVVSYFDKKLRKRKLTKHMKRMPVILRRKSTVPHTTAQDFTRNKIQSS